MFSKSILATSALLSLAAAVPLNQLKRDVVWVTETNLDIVTEFATQTVWVRPGETDPIEKPAHYGHHGHGQDKPAPTSEEEEAAPTTSEAPVEPKPAPEPTKEAPKPEPTSEAPEPEPTTEEPEPTYEAPEPTTQAPAPEPTTQAPAPKPEPTTQEAPKPEPTPEQQPEDKPTTQQASSNSGSSMSGMAAGTHSGEVTFYGSQTPGGSTGLGACGDAITNSGSAPIVAISEAMFDAYSNGNPNTNPLCGKTVKITGTGGQTHEATVVDRCPGCGAEDLDVNAELFKNAIGSLGEGRVGGIKWEFA